MTPCRATLALRVDRDRRVITIAVMTGPKILAEVQVKDVLAVVAQMERYNGSIEQADSADRDTTPAKGLPP
jgi:hypothetical protein